MNRKLRRNHLLVLVSLFVFAIQVAGAMDASQLSGSYQVVHETVGGSQTRIQLRIQLLNHGQIPINIQRLGIWTPSHSQKSGAQACSIAINGQASVVTTQEFTISRAEYRLWKRGTPPRLLLQVQEANGRSISQLVRLNPISERGN